MARTYRVKSAALNQFVSVRQIAGCSQFEVITADGVVYTPIELNLLRLSDGAIDAAIHNVKRAFGGTIVNVEDITVAENAGQK